MRTSRLALAVISGTLLFLGGALPTVANSSGGQFQEVVFQHARVGSSVGPGPEALTESDHFILTNGGAGWSDGPPVEYVVTDAPSKSVERAIDQGIATMDGFITTRAFSHVQASGQINPCTGQPNSVRWLVGDGPGGELAFTAICVDPSAKEIVGFRIAFDSSEDWATDRDPQEVDPQKIDLQNVATHEAGHVAGLDDISAPKDGCLTMYRYSSLGETQKRTPGWGDKLGLDNVYGPIDTTPGLCGS